MLFLVMSKNPGKDFFSLAVVGKKRGGRANFRENTAIEAFDRNDCSTGIAVLEGEKPHQIFDNVRVTRDHPKSVYSVFSINPP